MALKSLSAQVGINPSAPYLTATDYYNSALLTDKLAQQSLETTDKSSEVFQNLQVRQRNIEDMQGTDDYWKARANMLSQSPANTQSTPQVAAQPVLEQPAAPMAAQPAQPAQPAGLLPSSSATMPQITTRAMYDALPSGAQYTAPNGKMYRKR